MGTEKSAAITVYCFASLLILSGTLGAIIVFVIDAIPNIFISYVMSSQRPTARTSVSPSRGYLHIGQKGGVLTIHRSAAAAN